MDVGHFLRERIAFIRQLYAGATASFVDKMRKIEEGEEPFVPPYSEDEEPAFQAEWTEANATLQVLGYTCISMLDAALRLYLETSAAQLGARCGDSNKSDFKNGWLHGYKVCFAERLGICFDTGPADLLLLEELALARNRIQHPEDIASMRANYSEKDFKKLPQAFFVDEVSHGRWLDLPETARFLLFPPTVYITAEKLEMALATVEAFCHWLESEVDSRIRSWSK